MCLQLVEFEARQGKTIIVNDKSRERVEQHLSLAEKNYKEAVDFMTLKHIETSTSKSSWSSLHSLAPFQLDFL